MPDKLKIFYVYAELQSIKPWELINLICIQLIEGKRIVLVLDYIKASFALEILEELVRKEQDLTKLSFWGSNEIVAPVLRRYLEIVETKRDEK